MNSCPILIFSPTVSFPFIDFYISSLSLLFPPPTRNKTRLEKLETQSTLLALSNSIQFSRVGSTRLSTVSRFLSWHNFFTLFIHKILLIHKKLASMSMWVRAVGRESGPFLWFWFIICRDTTEYILFWIFVRGSFLVCFLFESSACEQSSEERQQRLCKKQEIELVKHVRMKFSVNEWIILVAVTWNLYRARTCIIRRSSSSVRVLLAPFFMFRLSVCMMFSSRTQFWMMRVKIKRGSRRQLGIS